MTKNVWLPYILSSVGTAGGGLLLLFLPETLPQKPPASPGRSSSEGEADKRNIQDRVRAGVHELRRSTAVIQRHRSVQLFLFVFFAAYLGRQVMKVLLLFAANRFHWTIAQVSSCTHCPRS